MADVCGEEGGGPVGESSVGDWEWGGGRVRKEKEGERVCVCELKRPSAPAFVTRRADWPEL